MQVKIFELSEKGVEKSINSFLLEKANLLCQNGVAIFPDKVVVQYYEELCGKTDMLNVIDAARMDLISSYLKADFDRRYWVIQERKKQGGTEKQEATRKTADAMRENCAKLKLQLELNGDIRKEVANDKYEFN